MWALMHTRVLDTWTHVPVLLHCVFGVVTDGQHDDLIADGLVLWLVKVAHVGVS